MRTAYKVLAYLVAAEVAVQAMVIVWFIAGLGKWVESGGVLDKAAMERGTPFPQVVGMMAHINNGFFVIPGLALLLLIISFFTKVRGAIKWAVIVFVLVVVQVMLGILGHEFTLGALHGLNALALFGVALHAGRLYGLRPQLPLSSLRRVPPPQCDESPLPSPPTRHSAGVADRPADRGNVAIVAPLAWLCRPAECRRLLGDGHGLPDYGGGAVPADRAAADICRATITATTGCQGAGHRHGRRSSTTSRRKG